MISLGSKKWSVIKKSSWLRLIVVGLLSLLFATSAFADTYNFFFTKPKKKTSASQQENQENKETPEQSESNEEDNANENESNGTRTKHDKLERGPITINNYNTLNGAPPSEAPNTATAAPSLQTTVMGPRSAISPWRFGLNGTYYPRKDIEPGFFERDPFNPASSPSQSAKAYGGLLSIGYVCSSVFTINGYGGAHHASSLSKTVYQMGMDAEVYPFAASAPWELNTLELGILAGASTSFFTDGKIGDLHAGARFSINFSPKFGLTTVGRIGTDALMVEAGIVTRL